MTREEGFREFLRELPKEQIDYNIEKILGKYKDYAVKVELMDYLKILFEKIYTCGFEDAWGEGYDDGLEEGFKKGEESQKHLEGDYS